MSELYANAELELYASKGDWDIVTWKKNGIPVKHEFFIVFMGTKQDFKLLGGSLASLNERQILGNGYHFFPYTEPEPGLRVEVKVGWELANEAQGKMFLEKFIQLVQK